MKPTFVSCCSGGFGTFETSTDVRYTAAFGDNADISQRLPVAIYEYTLRTPS
jgi:hypothetical protein